MSRWSVTLLAAVLAVACQPAEGEPLPDESLAAGALQVGRRAEGLAQLVQQQLGDKPALEVEVPELSGQLGNYQFRMQPVGVELQPAGLQLQPAAGAWQVTVQLVVSDPATILELSGAGGDSQCEVLVSLADGSADFSLLPAGDDTGFTVAEVGLQAEPPVVSLDAYCALAGDEQFLNLLAQHFSAALEEGSQLMAERLADTAYAQLVSGLEWLGSVAPQWPEGELAGALGYQVEVAGTPRLGEQAAIIELAAGFRAEPAGCLPAGLPRPANAPGPLDLPALLGQHAQAELALAVADELVVQVAVESWRAGLFCRDLSAGPLGQLRLADYFPSLESWQGAEARLLMRPGGRPTAQVDATGSPGLLPALVLDLPRMNFDFYLDSLGVDLRVLSVEADVRVRLRPRLDDQGGGLQLDGYELAAVEVTYHEALAEDDAALASGAKRLLGDVVELLASQLPAWPVSLPAGTGSLLGVERLPGYSVILLGP